MSVPIYMRVFSTGKISGKFYRTSTHDHPISKFLPRPMKKALLTEVRKKIIKTSDWILCPIYKKSPYGIQIGVTGSKGIKESWIYAAQREMGEEIGFLPHDSNNMKHILNSRYDGKSMKIYSIHISQTQLVPSLLTENSIALGRDDRTKKVGIFTYGSKDKMKNILKKYDIYCLQSNDGIQAVGMLNVGHILLSDVWSDLSM